MARERMTHAQLQEFLQSVGSKGGSDLNMRSEAIQKKAKRQYIPRIKREIRKVSRLLLPMDLAIPFDPETGVSSPDGFNASNCYRPPISATSSALILKEMSQTNEALKNTLMKRAGVTTWDNSNAEELTAEDWIVFRKYRVPRVFTIPAIHVDIPALSNSPFGVDYMMDVPRDENGNLVGEMPMILKINKLFRDIAYEEFADYQKQIDNNEVQHDDKTQKSRRTEIYKKIAVGDDSPRNFVTLIEIPLSPDSQLSSEFQFTDYNEPSVIRNLMVLSNYTKNLRECVEKFMDGSLKTLDTHFDYLEMDMSCPTTGDLQTNQGKAEFGAAVAYAQPVVSFSVTAASNPAKAEEIKNFEGVLGEFLDDFKDVEKLVSTSSGIRPIDNDTVSKILKALPSVLKLENPFVTQEVLKKNADVITLAFGDAGVELLEETDAGVSGKATGSLDETASHTEAKSYNLENLDVMGDDLVSEVTDDAFESQEMPAV